MVILLKIIKVIIVLSQILFLFFFFVFVSESNLITFDVKI